MKNRIKPSDIELLKEFIAFKDENRDAESVIAPFTGKEICTIPQGNRDDVKAAFARAQKAQKEWKSSSFNIRNNIFMRLHDLILHKQGEILDLVQLEAGKARRSAMEEVLDIAIVARHYAYNSEKHLKPKRRKGALPVLTSTVELTHPVGVVGIIAPWNYPLTLAITDAIPALISGNAVILKPASITPLAALWIAKLLQESGLPEDLFQIVTGKGSVVGEAIIDQADYLLFTGSTKTGKHVASKAGKRLIGNSMELGGKNPMIIFDDANIKKAADGVIRACFPNSGQLCVSTERIYVQESMFNPLITAIKRRTAKMKVGPGFDFTIDMGSLISEEQLKTVTEHVDDAVSKGAKVVIGGKARPDLGPYFYEPTILTDVNETMTIYREETFGPVVSVYPFKSIHEAVELANDSKYGLNASIWTKNIAKGREVAAQFEAGSVNINEAYAATWASVDAPMGGFKQSGIGRRHGKQGLLKFTESQTISVQRFMPLSGPKWLDQKIYAKIMTRALHLLKLIPKLR